MSIIDNNASSYSLGVLGGTFDPLHIGHINLAEIALKQANLNEVLFVPCSVPVLKVKATANQSTRLKMLENYISNQKHFSVSDIEIRRQTPSFTVETIQTVKLENDLQSHQIFFIVGADAVLGMPKWHEISKLSKLCQLLIYPRSNIDQHEVNQTVNKCGWYMACDNMDTSFSTAICTINRAKWLDGKEFEVSSSQIRNILKENTTAEDMSQYLDQSTLGYITQKGIYKS